MIPIWAKASKLECFKLNMNWASHSRKCSSPFCGFSWWLFARLAFDSPIDNSCHLRSLFSLFMPFQQLTVKLLITNNPGRLVSEALTSLPTVPQPLPNSSLFFNMCIWVNLKPIVCMNISVICFTSLWKYLRPYCKNPACSYTYKLQQWDLISVLQP